MVLSVPIRILLLPFPLFHFLLQEIKQPLLFLLPFEPPLLFSVGDSIPRRLGWIGSRRFAFDFPPRRWRRWFFASSEPSLDRVQQPFFGFIDIGIHERVVRSFIGETGAAID